MNEWMDGYLDMGFGTAIENGRLPLRFEYTGALTPDRAGELYYMYVWTTYHTI
jgi:hypothetical protein